MSTLTISFISGLIGSLITAFFNYKIRVNISEKAKRDEERRLAYVYVSQLSQYEAISFWVKYLVKQIIEDAGEEVPTGDFEVTHVVAVYIAAEVKKKVEEGNSDFYAKMGEVDNLLEHLSDLFTATSLANEQLAKLPKKTVFSYSAYESDLKNVVASFRGLKAILTSKELIKHFDAKDVNSFFEACSSLFASASKLRLEMAVYGNVSDDECSENFSKYVELLRARLGRSFAQDNKLKLARDYLDSNKDKPLAG